ncbi:hypothetical protein [Sinomicrobium weinanense]|uniref:Uncharacterized protein n=1 Tax=Sinomicrobium weinanense TaxID=2842200 RepID=A0A926Q0F8_9FLAO|nr:hypothetical protein [Sinomicrobium weinanense]MBC9794887.1 hypothetical protein [Sinomicrobium weinanense]MBU3125658.1 hypothetical protein [Sinomicrobium weinanense]
MRKSLIISILAITWLCFCGQKSNSKTGQVAIETEIIDSTKNNNRQPSLIQDLERYIYTDTTYASPTGKGITIQNSLPKGGSIAPDGTQYFDSSGKRYGFAVFWTRIINETTTPLELNINFPADSFAIFTPPDSYLKLFLPTDTLTYDKLSSYNYGLTGIKSFLDANFNKATRLQKTINPNEEHIFYVVTLSYQAAGTPRAALILKEQDLYYSMSISPNGSGTIPSGKIDFKNEVGN